MAAVLVAISDAFRCADLQGWCSSTITGLQGILLGVLVLPSVAL